MCDLLGKKAVTVLGEGRGVEHHVVDRQPDEPVQQHVELDPLDQLPPRPDRIEKLQKRRSQEPLRRSGGATEPRVERRKRQVRSASAASVVGQSPHCSQRIRWRDPRLDVDHVREQRSMRPITRPASIPRDSLRQTQVIMQKERTPAACQVPFSATCYARCCHHQSWRSQIRPDLTRSAPRLLAGSSHPSQPRQAGGHANPENTVFAICAGLHAARMPR